MTRSDVIEQTWAANQPIADDDLPVILGTPITTRIQFSRERPGTPIPKRVRFEMRHGAVIGTLDGVEVVVREYTPVEVIFTRPAAVDVAAILERGYVDEVESPVKKVETLNKR
jgi:hypothetical protein